MRIGIVARNEQFILNQLREGKYVMEIAAALNIDHSTISHKLAHSPHYRLAREIGSSLRVITLARAHKGSQALRWACMRHLYHFGPSLLVELGLAVPDIVSMARHRARMKSK